MEYRYMITPRQYEENIIVRFMRDLLGFVDDINYKFGMPVAFHNGYVFEVDLSGTGEMMSLDYRIFHSEHVSGSMSVVKAVIRPLDEDTLLLEVLDEKRDKYEFQIGHLINYLIRENSTNGRVYFEIVMSTPYQEFRLYIDPIRLPTKEELVEYGKKAAPYVKKAGEVAIETAPYWLPLVVGSV